MLKLYDPLEDYLSIFNSKKNATELKYYASEIVESLGLFGDEELKSAISRSFKICSSLHISIEANFKTIYRSKGKDLFSDWKLSPLACYLITINANPSNPKVAKAQLFLTKNNFNHV